VNLQNHQTQSSLPYLVVVPHAAPPDAQAEAVSIFHDANALDLSDDVVAAAFDLSTPLTRHTRPGVALDRVRGGIYGWTLNNCFSLLEPDSRAIKQHHGITPERAQRIGIRSISYGITGWTILEAAVQKQFGWRVDLPAGFYLDGERVRMCFPERDGLLVPCRDHRGFIQALRYYRHAADDSPVWVSSAKHGGAKAVPSLHFAGRSNAKRNGIVVLTDHSLRAETIYGGGAITVVALNGCTPFAVVAQLRAAYPALRGVILGDGVAAEPPLCRALVNAGLRWEAGL